MRAELAQEVLTAESFKAELLVEPWELTHSETCPSFKTFHDYMRAWMAFPPPPHPFPCPSKLKPLTPSDVQHGSIDEMGLKYSKELDERLSKIWTPGSDQAKIQLKNFLQYIFPVFGEARVRRHIKGTSKLSPHIRFGELSPRRMYHATRLCVSRWHPDANTSSSLAAVFGLSYSQSKDVSATTRTPEQIRDREKKGRVSVGRENASDNSACSSQHPNFGVRHNQIASETTKLVSHSLETTKVPSSNPSRSPSPPTFNTTDESSDGERGMPHISLSAKAFLKNLCLRDFSYHILFHHPNFNTKPLIPEFVDFPWAKDESSFDAWKFGKTGYPIVDAAMRELRTTGWIHNGMRFLLACFLTKYLLLPWTYGLKEFYNLLLDGDHSANALGWQWTSGSNTDSFPFSCLINPCKLARRQDPDGDYVRRWVPELAKVPTEYIHQPWLAPEKVSLSIGFKYGKDYPLKIVEPVQARKRAKEAMHFMKQVFAAKRPCIRVSEKPVEELLKDWPQDEPEDETANLYGGRAGLFPSLWSLFDEPSLLTSRDQEQSGHLTSIPNSDPGSGSIDNNSIERVLLNAYSSTDKEDLLIESMDVVVSSRESGPLSRRTADREKRQESRNGSGSQDAVMPTSTPTQLQHQILPSGMKPQKEMEAEAASILAQAGTRPTHLGGVHAFSGIGSRTPLLMSMQVNQMHQPTNPVMFDPMYAPGIAPTPTAPVPMTNFPMMMGHGHTNMDASVANGVNHSDMTSRAIYAHQMMYGLPFQMMHPQRTPVLERDQLYQSTPSNPANGTAAPNARHMNVGASTNFGVPYGLYGNHSFDHGSFVNPTPGIELNQYGAPVHIAPQQSASQVAPRGQHHTAPHSMYVTQNHRPDGVIGEAGPPTPNVPPAIAPNGRMSSVRQISPLPTLGDQQNSALQDAKVPVGVQSPRARQNAKEKRTVPGSKSAGAETDGASSRRARSTSKRGPSSTRLVAAGGITKQQGSGGNRRASSKSGIAGSPGNRSRTSRSKRGSGTRGGRSRSDSRSSSRVGDSSLPSPNNRNRRTHGDDEGPGSTTLKERQKILEGVGSQEDHEYYDFAQFLLRTYELTKNTDRHTSKDYIRLCTLKDNYHKQCPSGKEKLKIYTIKSFFSKILRLEVTGEYDRHSHGGVRGPYVYGIKLSEGPANNTSGTERR